MTSRWIRLSMLAGLAFSLGLAACDNQQKLTAPSDDTMRMASPEMMMKEGNGKGLEKKLRAVPVSSTEQFHFEFDAGPSGASYSLGGVFEIVVPKKAVKAGTHFVLDFDATGGEIVIHATATSKNGKVIDDVGALGFSPALTFRVNVGHFGLDANSVVLAWRNPLNGKLTAAKSRPDTDWVVAEIAHFTDWVVAE